MDIEEFDEDDNIFTYTPPTEETHKETEKLKRNTMHVSHAAAASLRYCVSSTATAAIMTGYLHDLISEGILTKEFRYLACDKSKVFRAERSVMESIKDLEETHNRMEPIRGIFMDGRKDLTKVIRFDEDVKRYYSGVIRETHITMTQEPEGHYLHHYTP